MTNMTGTLKPIGHLVPKNNDTKKPLVPRDKILFPPLHIKIGLVTQWVKNIVQTNDEVF